MEKGHIEVTGVPLEALVRAAYNPSRPQGLGFMHYQDGDLTDEEVAAIIGRDKTSKHIAVSMDYVKGRSCKFHVRRDGDKLFIGNSWYDHSTNQLKELLSSVGLSPDLVDKARQEEKEYHDDCVKKAIDFLASKNWSFKKSIDDELEWDIDLGLDLAHDRKLISASWTDDGRLYTKLSEKAA